MLFSSFLQIPVFSLKPSYEVLKTHRSHIFKSIREEWVVQKWLFDRKQIQCILVASLLPY